MKDLGLLRLGATNSMKRWSSSSRRPFADRRITWLTTTTLRRFIGTQLDHGEFIETFTATLDEALAWLDRGEITDSKTMIGVLLMARHAAAGR